ncbi:MAG TPA: TolC family protein, partial [Thermoanaerobaculia bacterium]|nr:TolC family protein [Thermoanaerobaculia bacterium]
MAVLAALLAGAAAAQEPAPLALGEAERLAYAADPRLRQLELEAAASELRLADVAAERLPAITVGAEALAQSESVEIPFDPPGGAAPPEAPTETVDAHVQLERALLDPTRAARIAAERARLAEARARIETAVAGLRREVDEAFFAAALVQERAARLATAIEDLEARLREAELRVAEGVALPSEAAAVEAEILRLRQEAAELAAGRRAALERLGLLVGRPVGSAEALVLPDLGAAVAAARER